MAKCTQNSAETLENAVISTIVNNVNTAIRFFDFKPSTAMRISLEETIIENLTFAELVATKSEAGKEVFGTLKKMNDDVIDQIKVLPIQPPLSDQFVKDMEELLNEGKL